MKKSIIPEYAKRNMGLRGNRDYKQRKRREFRELLKAVDAFRIGCARIPAYTEFNSATQKLEEIRVALSIKEWSR